MASYPHVLYYCYGDEIFIPHPRKQCKDYLIDLKLGNIINGVRYKTIKNAKFQEICCFIFKDMTSYISYFH